MMIKIAFLCIIIAIGYIHCDLMTITNDTDLPIVFPSTNVKQVNKIDDEQMKFLASLSLSTLTTTPSNEKLDNMNAYYNWLHFLRTSSSTQTNNVTEPSKKA